MSSIKRILAHLEMVGVQFTGLPEMNHGDFQRKRKTKAIAAGILLQPEVPPLRRQSPVVMAASSPHLASTARLPAWGNSQVLR
jgi:hypothetical protein